MTDPLRALIAKWREEAEWEAANSQYSAALDRCADELEAALAHQSNIAGDDLCWITDPDAAKALPEAEFLESCRRYRQQIADERGETHGGKTIAQLEAEVARLTGDREDTRRQSGEAGTADEGSRSPSLRSAPTHDADRRIVTAKAALAADESER